MDYIVKNRWLILFVVWDLPLSYCCGKFRKVVYQTDRWTINIKPVFWKAITGLSGNIYPDNLKYKRSGNFYLFYLAICFLLFISYLSLINKSGEVVFMFNPQTQAEKQIEEALGILNEIFDYRTMVLEKIYRP